MHRCLTQRSRRTPCGGIVDIDIGHETLFQAIHQAVIHDVIHSAVATRFAGHFSSCLPERMLVLFAKCIDVLPILLSLGRRRKYAVGNQRKHPLCPNRVEPAVRPRIHYVMLEKDRAALLGFYDAGVHVAADVFFRALGVSVSESSLLHMRSTRPRLNSPKPCSRTGRRDGYPCNGPPGPARESDINCRCVSCAETGATYLPLHSLSICRADRGDTPPRHA